MASSGHKIIAIDKSSSVSYLRAVFAAWRTRQPFMPVECGAEAPDIGWPVAGRVATDDKGGWFAETLEPDDSPEPAQISFTSGTTGEPKAILLSRRALSDVTGRLLDVMELDETIAEYVAVPVTFSFGLGRIRAIAAVGGKAWIPDAGFRPDEFARMLEAREVNALSAVPTMLRLLIRQPDLFRTCGQHLKWLEIGSQYMSADEKQAVRALFPEARIVQHYGLTEASRTSFLTIDAAPDGQLESVGQPTGSSEVRIDEDGRICIRGDHVADGSVTAGKLTPLVDCDGWLRTSDLGALKNGMLYYEGRADDLLNVSGIKIPAELFERRLDQQADLPSGHFAVAGRPDSLRGWSVMICFLPGVSPDKLQAAALQAASGLGLGSADIQLVPVPELPRTGTGKIQRRRLTELYGEAPVYCETGEIGLEATDDMSPAEQRIAQIWSEALGVARIGRNDSFFDVGGDSLSAINMMLKAEQAGLPRDLMGHIFDGRTVAEIAALTAEPDSGAGDDLPAARRGRMAEISDAVNSTRGVLVLMVIAAHWGPFFFERLGPFRELAYQLTYIPFRLGTPGFAMVFGMGLGLFYMAMLENSSQRLRQKLRSNTLILAVGVVLNAAVVAAEIALNGRFDAIWPERLFYTVLLFYLLMLPTAELWLRFVRLSRQMIPLALLLAAMALGTWWGFSVALADDRPSGFASLARLMLVANYSYPLMLSEVAIGLAIGLWIRSHQNAPDLLARSVKYGLLLLAAGIVLIPLTGGSWLTQAGGPLSFVAFAGAVLLLFAAFQYWTSRGRSGTGLKLLIITGILAFPAFVGHGLVIPLKDIMAGLGLPELVAMAVAVGLFLVAAIFAYRKLFGIYYGHLSRPAP